jgi:ketosteroid isomerase-like protein
MMRMSIILRLAAVLSCIAFFGASPAQNKQTTDADIIHLVEGYDNAWNSKDATAVTAILAADYVYFSSKGATESRQHMLDMLLSPKYTMASAQRSEMEVHRTSTTAVVSSRWKGHGTYDGQEFHDDQRCSIVLGREKQGWQVLSEHCTQIAIP